MRIERIVAFICLAAIAITTLVVDDHIFMGIIASIGLVLLSLLSWER